MRRCIPAALALVVFLTACGKVPPVHYYTLSVPGDFGGALENVITTRSVGVKPFAAQPPYDQDRIVYRIGEDTPEIGFYAYHRWAAPPSRLLADVVAREMTALHPLWSFEPARSGIAYDGVLEGRILILEEVDTPDGARARVQLDLALRSREGNLAWTGTVSGQAASREATVESVVRAVRTAVRSALQGAHGRMAGGLAGLGRRMPAGTPRLERPDGRR